MTTQIHHQGQPDIVGIVRAASVYEWLIARSQVRRRPTPLPAHLHVDLGLPPAEARQERYPLG